MFKGTLWSTLQDDVPALLPLLGFLKKSERVKAPDRMSPSLFLSLRP